jgi:effector-binding domain-containing protein
MKKFKKVLIGLLGLIVLLLIIAFLLPSKYHVERSTVIAADKSTIFNLTSHLQKWDLWTPWNKELDSTVKFELIGPDGQLGTKRTWDGKILKDGEMTLTLLIPGETVGYDLAFNKGQYKSHGMIKIETLGDSCKVSWTDDGDLGYNPFNRYMGLFMGKMMNPDFDKGLAKLKKMAEERKSWPKMEETKIPEQFALIVVDSAGPKDYQQVMGKAYGEIFNYLQASGLKQIGAPFSISLKWDSITKASVMKIGIPVNKEGKNKGRIIAEKIPEQNAVMAYYFGPYEKIEPAYYALDQYIKEINKEVTGGPWEVYISDPMKEKDLTKLETHILFPVK